MKSKQTNAVFQQTDRERIISLLKEIGGDGHTIWKDSVLTQAGFDESFLKRFCHLYKSDGSYKGTLFDSSGKRLVGIAGVYGLDLHEAICSDLKIAYERKMGRGFQAQACLTAIMGHFKIDKLS